MFPSLKEDLPPIYTRIPDTSHGEQTIQHGPRASGSQLSRDQNASTPSKSTSQKSSRSSKRLWKQVMLEVRDIGIMMSAGRSGWIAPDVHVPPPSRSPHAHAKSLSVPPTKSAKDPGSTSSSAPLDKPRRATCRSHTLPPPSRIFTSISSSMTSKTTAAT